MVADPDTSVNAVDQLPRSVRGLLDSPYARYLDLETILDIQAGERGGTLHHPDEVLFRSVHMSSELWLRMAGYDIERLRAAAQAGALGPAARLARRVRLSLERVIENTAMLETMAAADYHQFRIYFGNASGLQSPGYAYVRRECRGTSAVVDRLVSDDDALFALYTTGRDDPRYDLCEALFEIDATLDRFRATHLQIAERFLGEATAGTGGSEGVPYLRRNLGQRLFPRLWAVRERISAAAGPVSYAHGTPEPGA